MTAMNVLHRRSGTILREVVTRVPPARLNEPTPCAEWDVRDLLHHIAWSNLWVGPLVSGQSLAEVTPRLAGDILGDDPLGVTAGSIDASSDAFDRPGAMERDVELSRGPSAGSVYCAERMNDLTVHAWDLAAAVGLTVDLDAECMEAAMAYYRPMEPRGRPAGMFGPPVEAAPDASLQTRFLAFWGRRADWSPTSAG